MPAVVVPDLKRKFALLRTFPKPRSWADLAGAFSRSVKTLELWQNGNGSHDPDRMPDWAVPILTRLIGKILMGERSDEELHQLAFGSGAVLEEEVRTGAGASMLMLIAREGRHATSSLIRKSDGIVLVEIETTVAAPHLRVRLGELFRIVVKRRRRDGYVMALQHAQAVWALVPTGAAAQDPQSVLIPGIHANGHAAFMRERRDPGRHLFVCLETPDPPPAHVKAHGRDETILDKRALNALAAFFEAQRQDRRACHILDLQIEAAPP